LHLNDYFPGRAEPFPETMPLEHLVFGSLGAAGLLIGAVAVIRLARLPMRVLRWLHGIGPSFADFSLSRPSRVILFLLLWLLLEVLGYRVLTPFVAVRRVLGVLMVGTLLVGRLAALTCRSPGARRTVFGIAAYGAILALIVEGVDVVEAYAEKNAVEEAARRIRAAGDGGTVWYVGHWGFQYYAEREGMRPISAYDAPDDSPIPIPPRSVFRKGDWLVLPEFDWSGIRFGGGVHRQRFTPDGDRTEHFDSVVVTDPLPLQTIITYYSGFTAVEHHDGPRLRAEIRRVLEDHAAEPRRLSDN
jgi:hypothetical protein